MIDDKQRTQMLFYALGLAIGALEGICLCPDEVKTENFERVLKQLKAMADVAVLKQLKATADVAVYGIEIKEG